MKTNITQSKTKLTENFDAHREELRMKLIELKEKHSLTELTAMSKGGISTAYLSNIINNVDLHKISIAMWNKVEALVKSKTERTGWTLINTANSKLIYETCEAALAERTMKMIIGPTGYGKTTALDAFARNNSNAVVYVLMDSSMNVRDCLVVIAGALRISTEGTQHQLVRAIAKRLIERGCLLILDDCGKVIQKFFRVLQVIYDQSEGSCGMVLAGVPALKTHLLKNANKNKESYPELISRVSYTQELHAPTEKAVEAICHKQGITDARAIQYIYKSAKNYRDVRNIILATRRLKTEGITAEDIKSVNVGGFYNN